MNQQNGRNNNHSVGSTHAASPQEHAEEGNIEETPAKASHAELTERELAQRPEATEKSTGSRTAEGKARFKLNARRHGLYAEDIVNPVLDDPDDVANYRHLQESLRDHLKPEGLLEQLLVEEIGVCSWRLKRTMRSESRQARVAEEGERVSPSPGFHQAADLALPLMIGEDWGEKETELYENISSERSRREAAIKEAGLDRTLPAPGQDAILRYETAVKRHLFRALNALMRLQKARR